MTTNLATNRLLTTDPGQSQIGPQSGCGVNELAEPLAPPAQAASAEPESEAVRDEPVKEFGLDRALEEARVVTGATGAAIALAWGAEMICLATAGPGAPDLGTRFDPGTGLSGCCMQTRQLQQCGDTETDPRVDLEACRYLGVRSIVVLPLMDSGELFGILEVFWSRPNAFGQADLSGLQALAARILELRTQSRKGTLAVPGTDLALNPVQPELLTREILPASVRHNVEIRRSGYWTGILTITVVALAVLLGWLMGRAGWNMAVNQAQGELAKSPNEVSDVPAAPTQTSPEATNGSLLTPVEPENPDGVKQQPIEGPAVMDVWVGTDGAKQPDIQGPVVMNALIGTDGLVRELKLISGDPQLAEAVNDAVRRWHFKPRSLEGRPVEFETRITVKFALP